MLDWLLAAPVVAKVLGSLALILVVQTLTRSLAIATVVGIVALGTWTGHPWGLGSEGLAGVAWGRVTSADDLFLLLVVYQVITLSSQMAQSGVMRDLVAAVQRRVSQRGAMAVLPAVVGLLPMPGGALFSAPMVDQCDPGGTVGPMLKTQTNYWFRHIWEYWWPLYPGVLLAMTLTKLDVWQFALLQLPITAVMIGTGYWFFLRRIHPPVAAAANPVAVEGPRHSLVLLVMPIIITIACYGLGGLGYAQWRHWHPLAPQLNRYTPMAIGLALAMLWLQSHRRLPWAEWRRMLCSVKTLQLMVLVALVRIFGSLIEARLPGGVQVAEAMRQEFAAWGVPVVLVIVVIPLLSGMSTGLAVGFVGASFPVVLGLLGAHPALGPLLATTVLAYAAGHQGMMLSPVHICLVVTNQHFGTSTSRSVVTFLLPAAIVIATGGVMYLLLRLLFG